MGGQPPLACRMDALSPEQRERRQALGLRLRPRVEEVRELEDGLAFRFAAGAASLGEAAEFISLERLCCPFFRFALEVEAEGGPAWLRITGREGVKDFLREAFSL